MCGAILFLTYPLNALSASWSLLMKWLSVGSMSGYVSLLLNRAGLQNPISITHQEIASELGSWRQVISRILEDFGVNKWIDMQRGEIKI